MSIFLKVWDVSVLFQKKKNISAFIFSNYALELDWIIFLRE